MSIEMLNPQYRILNTIQSAEHRGRLIAHMCYLTDELPRMGEGRIDDRTLKIIQRFFKYLNESCISSPILNQRAKWLSCYIQIIYDHLTKTLPVNNNVMYADKELPADHLFNKAVNLAQQICIHRTIQAVDPYIKETELNLLDQILESSRHKVMDFANLTLVQIDQDLQTVTEMVTSKNVCHAYSDGNDTNLTQQLQSLAHRLNRG